MADQKTKPKLVKYLTYRDRYVREEYVRATPEAPAVILLPEGQKENALLQRMKEEVPIEEQAQVLKPHHAPTSTPAGVAPAHTRDRVEGRPSDSEPPKQQ